MSNEVAIIMANKNLDLMPRGVIVVSLDEITNPGPSSIFIPAKIGTHSLPQLILFLADCTRKLIDLMQQKGSGVLIRFKRNEIEMLKEIINIREHSSR